MQYHCNVRARELDLERAWPPSLDRLAQQILHPNTASARP
jgi:hypothetical protein